ncbi:MAG: hypothetical protein GX974_04805, partial [Clostridiales bacterium]|nr:hypothetical protein [Clostridiales bacterium]
FSDMFIYSFNNIAIALISIIVIIFIGVIFDIIGIAIATADEIPFLSMASKKVKGAGHALVLIRNAGQVSSFCNDVIGDICGILSGSAGIALVTKLLSMGNNLESTTIGLLVSSLIASMTVGGKAYGKTFAIANNQKIVLIIGYLISIFHRKGSPGRPRKKNKKE